MFFVLNLAINSVTHVIGISGCGVGFAITLTGSECLATLSADIT
jgi:hypothetical protein